MNKYYLAQQANRALQLFAQNMNLSETEAMEIADLYEPWEAEKLYLVGKIVKYGVNKDNETQLYSVVQQHTSQNDWKPNITPALYKAIGFKDDVSIWTQPLSYDDAYLIGDIVSHNDVLWECEQGNANGVHGLRNTFEPGVWGWKQKV